MKKLQIKDNIAHIISAHAVSVATQFIVCSVGIGDAPQQAKLQGVYHLALLATIVSKENTISPHSYSFDFTKQIHFSQKRVILFTYLLKYLVNS